MTKIKLFSFFAGASVLLASSLSALAEMQTLTVAVDESQILQLPGQPGAVIVGNPSIADVSIQGQKLFVHGRSFGQTNLIILDLQGNQIASFNLVGSNAQDTLVSLYKGPERFSYSCTGTCESTFQIGDSVAYNEQVKAQMTSKFSLATGSSTSEASSPQQPR